MRKRPRVLMFSLIDFSKLNGGVLCSVDILDKLHTVPNIDILLISCTDESARAANEKAVADRNLEHIFLPIFRQNIPRKDTIIRSITAKSLDLVALVSDKYNFFYERFYLQQHALDMKLAQIVDREKPDLVLIDGSWSAFSVPTIFELGIPCCLITHNHEVDIHRDFKYYVQDSTVGTVVRHGFRFWFARHFNWISNIRFRKRVYRLYSQCAGIIALTRNDLPIDLPTQIKQAVLPPLLMESRLRWRSQGRRSVLFVGNTKYFANRLAVEWLCNCLAPELLRLDDSVHINIVGAGPEDVNHDSRHQNVNFLGQCDKDELVRHLTSDDLLIAPTTQTYGAKLKLAECASHGMPFIATNSAMAGLPFLTFVPRIDLNDPRAAADLVLRYVNSSELLLKLSQEVTERMELARKEQTVAWSSFIQSLLSRSNHLDTTRPSERPMHQTDGAQRV